MTRTFLYDHEEGQTHGRDVYLSDEESTVLGPDGEPLRKSHREKIGFDLRAVRKVTKGIRKVTKA